MEKTNILVKNTNSETSIVFQNQESFNETSNVQNMFFNIQQINKENINQKIDGNSLLSDTLLNKNDIIQDRSNGLMNQPQNLLREYREIPDSNLWCFINENSQMNNNLPPNVNLLPKFSSHLAQNNFTFDNQESNNCLSSQVFNPFDFNYNGENVTSPLSPNSVILYSNRLDTDPTHHIPTENLHVTKYTVHHVPTSNEQCNFIGRDHEITDAVIREQILKMGVLKKPLSPYMSFSKMVWPKVKEMCPGVGVGTVGATIGQLWRELDSNLKKQMVDSYLYEKKLYEESVAEYVKRTGIKPNKIKKTRSQNSNLSETLSQTSCSSSESSHHSINHRAPKIKFRNGRNAKKKKVPTATLR